MSLTNTKTIIPITLVSLLFLSGYAIAVEERGAGTVDYGSRLSTDEKIEARLKAKINAVKKYVSRNQRLANLYNECLSDDIKSRIDEFIDESRVLKAEKDKEFKQYQVVVKASINEAYLKNAMLKECKGSPGQRNGLMFVFFARQQTKAGDYKVALAHTEVESDVEEYFINNQFRVLSTVGLEQEVPRFKKDRLEQQFVETGKLKWHIAKDASGIKADYFAFGTFDIRHSSIDSDNGKVVVEVVAQGQVEDLGGDDKVSSIGRMSVKAFGDSEGEAASKALRQAALQLAEQMVFQINDNKIQ